MEDSENRVEKSNEAMSDFPSTSFVERVAAAAWESSRRYYKKLANIDLAPWGEESDVLRKERCDHARMVIDAMREPTKAMLAAGENMLDHNGDNYPPHITWRKMIDEALK